MSEKLSLNTEVNTSELAVVLGITGRRVRQLAEDGVFEKRDGTFLLAESVQKYIASISARADGSSNDKARQEAETSIKKAKAVITVMEAKELQGKMHRSEDVAAMTEDLIYSIRGMLIALPGRLAVDVTTAQSPAEAAEIIRKEVYSIMKELAGYQYDPKKYEERVRERKDWDSLESDLDDE